MANPNRPSGFTPWQYLNGSPWSGQARTYSIDASYSGADLYIGDPVISGGSADANGVPNIAIGATTPALRGVIVGLGVSEGESFDPNNLSRIYRPSGDTRVWYAKVVDDPNVIFMIQEHVGAAQMAAVDVGNNQIGYSGTAGNGFLSGWQVACTTDAASGSTNTLQLRLLGLARIPNNTFGAYAKWLVQINVHELGHGVGAAGV